MRGRLFKIALLLMLLTFAGCFRPAADGIEPTSDGEQQPAAPTITPQQPTPLPVDLETEQADSANTTGPTETETNPSSLQSDTGGATATFPPITVIPPTRATLDTFATALPGGSPTFITPGSPELPVATDAPRGTPTGGAFTSTPSGLITPTDFVTQDECVYTVQPGDSLFRIATDRGL